MLLLISIQPNVNQNKLKFHLLENQELTQQDIKIYAHFINTLTEVVYLNIQTL